MIEDERFWVRQKLLLVFVMAMLLYFAVPAVYRLFWSYGNQRPYEVSEEGEIDLRSVNVNRGSDLDLASLPDIGPTLARRIIEDRERNGPYTCLKDLERVKGIGPDTSHKIEPYVLFEPHGNQERSGDGTH